MKIIHEYHCQHLACGHSNLWIDDDKCLMLPVENASGGDLWVRVRLTDSDLMELFEEVLGFVPDDQDDEDDEDEGPGNLGIINPSLN